MSKVDEMIDYFHTELKTSKVAKDYLKSRKINKDTVLKFKLGYCPHTPKYVYIERFRDRLMFPIWNQQGLAVGWIGRTLVDDRKKYVNVRESALFKKNRLLYGYNFAKEHIITTGKVILVEGQMDVVTLFQEGILNVVASSGTSSFKNAGACLLGRYDPHVYIVFDEDDAGRKARVAAEKSLDTIGITNTTIVKLPEKEDPASYIFKYGKQKFLGLLNV